MLRVGPGLALVVLLAAVAACGSDPGSGPPKPGGGGDAGSAGTGGSAGDGGSGNAGASGSGASSGAGGSGASGGDGGCAGSGYEVTGSLAGEAVHAFVHDSSSFFTQDDPPSIWRGSAQRA